MGWAACYVTATLLLNHGLLNDGGMVLSLRSPCLNSAGASLNEPPPRNYNNWPSVFCFLVFTLQNNNRVIHLHAPEKIFPTRNMRPMSIREPPPVRGIRSRVLPPALLLNVVSDAHETFSHETETRPKRSKRDNSY